MDSIDLKEDECFQYKVESLSSANKELLQLICLNSGESTLSRDEAVWGGKTFHDYVDDMKSEPYTVFTSLFKNRKGLKFSTYKKVRSSGLGKASCQFVFCFSAEAQEKPLLSFLRKYIQFYESVKGFSFSEKLGRIIKATKPIKSIELNKTIKEIELERIRLSETIEKLFETEEETPKNYHNSNEQSNLSPQHISAKGEGNNISEIVKSDIPIETPPYIISWGDINQEIDLNPCNHHSIKLFDRETEIQQLNEFLNGKKNFSFLFMIAPSGAGKTRLATEWMRTNVDEEKWHAGFVYEHSRDILKQWQDWKPTCDTLIVIDYIYRFKDIVNLVIKKGASEEKYRIRLIIIDHVLPDNFESSSLDSLTLNAIDKDGARFDFREQFLHKFSPMRLEESGSRKSLIFNIIAYVSGLDKDCAEVKIIYHTLKTMGDEKTSFSEHPLFAILIAEAFKVDGIKSLKNWARKDLINHYFRSERRLPWKLPSPEDTKKFNNAGLWASVCVASATALQGVSFSDLLSCLPHANDMTKNEEDRIISWCNRIVSSRDQQILKKFEPDILGENFFLLFFREFKNKKEVRDVFISMLCRSNKNKHVELEINVKFIEFFRRLTRNLSNDNQGSQDIHQAWEAIIEFLKPENFSQNLSLQVSASLANIEIADILFKNENYDLSKQFVFNVNCEQLNESVRFFKDDRSSKSSFIDIAYSLTKYFDQCCILNMLSNKLEEHFKFLLKCFESWSSFNETKLFLPCVVGGEHALRWILKTEKYDINQPDKEGWTPLLIASANGYQVIVHDLIAMGEVKVNHATKTHGWTALMFASKNGYEEIVKDLIATGKVDIDLANEGGETALMLACSNGHESVVRFLIDSGTAETDLCKKNGDTALLLACNKGYESVVRTLITIGKANINHLNNYGVAAFITACEWGHEKVVSELLATGKVDTERYCRLSNGTGFMLACKNGHDAVVRALIDADKVEVDLLNSNFMTAFMLACEEGHEAVVRDLIACGKLDIDLDIDGVTPLKLACENGHEGIVRDLIASGQVNVNHFGTYNQTPLMLACENGHESVIRVLIATGKIEMDRESDSGKTALMLACRNGHVAVVSALITTGKVNIDYVGENCETALMLASENGHNEIVHMLIKKGATTNKKGVPALQYARYGGAKCDAQSFLRNYCSSSSIFPDFFSTFLAGNWKTLNIGDAKGVVNKIANSKFDFILLMQELVSIRSISPSFLPEGELFEFLFYTDRAILVENKKEREETDNYFSISIFLIKGEIHLLYGSFENVYSIKEKAELSINLESVVDYMAFLCSFSAFDSKANEMFSNKDSIELLGSLNSTDYRKLQSSLKHNEASVVKDGGGFIINNHFFHYGCSLFLSSFTVSKYGDIDFIDETLLLKNLSVKVAAFEQGFRFFTMSN